MFDEGKFELFADFDIAPEQREDDDDRGVYCIIAQKQQLERPATMCACGQDKHGHHGCNKGSCVTSDGLVLFQS